MAKKKIPTAPIQEIEISSPYYSGKLSEISQEAKDKMKAEKPEIHKMIFGEIEPEPETVNE